MRIIFFTLLSMPLLVQAQSSSENEILILSKKKFDWMVKLQFDSLGNLLDDRVQYVHSNGWIETKTEVLDDIRSGKLDYRNVEVLQAAVRLYGATAIVNGRGKFQYSLNGSIATIELGYTEVYIKNDGRWQLVSRHANRMP